MDSAAQFSLAFLESQPAGAARVLDAVDSVRAAEFLADAPTGATVRALAYVQPAHAAEIIRRLPPKQAADMLLQMPAGSRSILLRALPQETIDAVLAAVTTRQRAAIRRYLAYSPGTVGAWMDAPRMNLTGDTSVGDAIQRIRDLNQRPGPYVFVTDPDRRLLGSVPVDRLLSEDNTATLGDVMDRDVPRLLPQAPLASVISLPAWDTALALPVVDQKRRLIGTLGFDSLREGIKTDRGSTGAMQINRVVFQIAEAYLICLSGLFQVAASKNDLTRFDEPRETRDV